MKTHKIIQRGYLTCNCDKMYGTYRYTVLDKDENIVIDGIHKKEANGPTAYKFNVSTAGYYYVKISGITGTVNSSLGYSISVGSPTYFSGGCTIPCKEGTVVMSSSNRRTDATFDGTLLSDIPEDAVAYSVRINGIKSTSASSIRLENEKRGLSIDIPVFSSGKAKLTSMNFYVDSIWKATFSYRQNTSFTPTLTISYVYPVYEDVLP